MCELNTAAAGLRGVRAGAACPEPEPVGRGSGRVVKAARHADVVGAPRHRVAQCTNIYY